MKDFWMIIHILGAGTWFGANLIQVFMTPRVARVGGASAALWQRSVAVMGVFVYSPAAIVVLVSGLFLVSTSDDVYTYSDAFVILGILTVVTGAVLGIRYFGPKAEQAADAYEKGERSSGDAIAKKAGAVWAMDSVLVMVTLATMVLKWKGF